MSHVAALVSLAVTLAGPDYRWDNPNAPRQMDSAHKQGMALIVAERQGGICVACGDILAGEATNICHIVASRISGRGIMAGNFYIGHQTSCNDTDAKVYGDIVPLDSLVRSDLIVTELPTRAECVARFAEIKARKVARAERRAAHLATMGA